ncbi:aldehyde dehydrogenase (NADP(+)) [Burkholderia sp. FERM BP-3421]|uniref:aldehyde dehydrogenase (NADP(+)) n=1 Tax=Burkholderia sp. FERM BP-3421 TaxID=1494466 RepID=UPI002362779E|nr:aldehyde dehydrogenase (NADP(+)) [Burkholderia sp. FERM BP-3421]WDD91317.1 aldehyde dehydrogenase (NADP(+)) [Burkholderia sp. FERM BP-3421]
MVIEGKQLIGRAAAFGANGTFHAIAAATGEALAPAFGGATPADLDTACRLADAAFDAYRETPPAARAAFLDAIGAELVALGDALVERCCAETGLPRARIEGERARTVGQLAMFATLLREGGYLGARIDNADPGGAPLRMPLPCNDLRLRNIALGPVAVFGASNFPLAFSVAGGDTASALAAGCPVIVKAHPAHPGTSELVGRAIQRAARACGMPEGVFALLFDAGHAIGQALAADPRIKAVGFTGSRAGGAALMRIAAARAEPIPVYAEMSAVNPVLLLPGALAARAATIAQQFVASLTLGAGQFCTNPGLVLAVDGPALRAFEQAAAAALDAAPAATMLTPAIDAAYRAAVEARAASAGVVALATGAAGGPHTARAALFATAAETFMRDAALRDEVFGAASLIVRCSDEAALHALLASLEGQLTIAVHADDSDAAAFGALLPLLERRAGRILANGFGTGVAVCDAMVHGGPFPASSDARTTSVGSRAIERFLRPVCYQDFPADCLPTALRDGNPLGIARRVNGVDQAAETRDA